MFKNILSIKDFSDLARKNYVFDDVIPAADFSRLSHYLIESNQKNCNQILINLEFINEQSVDPKIKGRISTSLTMQCQRCLGPIDWHAETSIDFLLIDSLSSNKTGLSSVNIITVDSAGLSIEKIVEDEILSMIPMSLMHNKVALCENNDTLGLFLASSNKSKGNQQKNKHFSGLDKLLKAKDRD
jgi:uncharacterized metal-binding protein YceD (DUF177 family)